MRVRTEGGTVSEGLIQREVPSVRVRTEGGTVSEGKDRGRYRQ